jgi:hypothetical protein
MSFPFRKIESFQTSILRKNISLSHGLLFIVAWGFPSPYSASSHVRLRNGNSEFRFGDSCMCLGARSRRPLRQRFEPAYPLHLNLLRPGAGNARYCRGYWSARQTGQICYLNHSQFHRDSDGRDLIGAVMLRL